MSLHLHGWAELAARHGEVLAQHDPLLNFLSVGHGLLVGAVDSLLGKKSDLVKAVSIGRVMGLRSEGPGFDPHPMLEGSGVKAMSRVNYCWYLVTSLNASND